MIKIKNNQNGFIYVEILLGIVLVSTIGLTAWRISSVNSSVNNSIKNTEEASKQLPIYNSNKTAEEAIEQDEPGQSSEEEKQDSDETPQTVSQAIEPPNTTAEPVEKKVIEKTNCIPDGASEYAKTYLSYSNSQFLANKYYTDATKFYDAVNFAGLGATIDSKKTVVLAPNNYTWDQKLSDAEETYFNQSASNMKELVGWHIVLSCFIYSGNAENINGTVTVDTLNGPVTFNGSSSIGEFNGVRVAIWDWFTSNGAVTFMTDFVKKPTVP